MIKESDISKLLSLFDSFGLDYATALAGCHPESETPTVAYDEAAKSLIEYRKEVLGDDYE